LSVTREGEERLVVAQEMEPRASAELEDILRAIRETLSAEHELQAHAVLLLKPGSIPKTSSGKIQRHMCRAMFLEGSLEAIAQWHASPAVEVQATTNVLAEAASGETGRIDRARLVETGFMESWLRAQLSALLKIGEAQIDLDQPIMRYGLDSLVATELAHTIRSVA
jgi:hypothetical protein